MRCVGSRWGVAEGVAELQNCVFGDRGNIATSGLIKLP